MLETCAILKIQHRSLSTPVSNTNAIQILILGLKTAIIQTLTVIQKEGLQMVARCELYIRAYYVVLHIVFVRLLYTSLEKMQCLLMITS